MCATRGGRPGLCPSNADSFLTPFGPPVIQVSSEDAPFLDDDPRFVVVLELSGPDAGQRVRGEDLQALVEQPNPRRPRAARIGVGVRDAVHAIPE